MEKISHILPSSPRVSSTDVKESQPMRPGVPTFGNPQGASALADRVSLRNQSSLEPSAAAHNEVMDWRGKDLRNATIAQQVSNAFFAKSRPATPEASAPMKIEDDSREKTADRIALMAKLEDMGGEGEGEMEMESYSGLGSRVPSEIASKGTQVSIKA